MNIFARLLLSKLPSSDAPETPTVAASAGPAAPHSPGAAGHGEADTSELLRRAEMWLGLWQIGSVLNRFDRETLDALMGDLRDRAAQFESIGD